ncbi:MULTISPECIES: hypothetical protein [unclassified Microbacterium]|uniref:hypothetical protein n=1 Tax=unclassified Microbacterium TaxID=2609290 RepID=UPI000EAA8439|nr:MULTISPECIES: hypothetical protein [unclassified Microbacterium]MBT2486649.1 hypothetical protein [Microbacterium sp. ISL-108]RKN69333.1 hypothetical protein D7252_18285 [Microbacterium sp. CGR2]
MSLARRTLAALASLLPAIAIAVTYLFWKEGLGSQVAFHWDARGRVDGVIETGGAFGLALGIAATAGAVAAIVVLLKSPSLRTKRDVLTWTGFFAGIGMALWLVPAGLTYAAGNAQDAELNGWLALLAALLLYGVLLRTCVPCTEQREIDQESSARTITTGWAATVYSPQIGIAFAIFLGAGAGGLAAAQEAPVIVRVLIWAVLAVAAVALVAFVGINVRVDQRGLRIRSALLRFPFKQVPADKLGDIRTTTVHASDWGGWGIRKRSGSTAFIVNGHHAVSASLRDGGEVLVTVPEQKLPRELSA